jgi:hypothetical protein
LEDRITRKQQQDDEKASQQPLPQAQESSGAIKRPSASPAEPPAVGESDAKRGKPQ